MLRQVAVVLKWAYLAVLAVVAVVPMLWLLVSAFKTTPELFSAPLRLPSHWSFANFTGAVNAQPLLQFLGNSVLIALVATVANIAVSTLAAYALRHRFRGNGAVRNLLSAGLLVPFTAFMTPIFYLVYHLGLYGSDWGIALVYVGTLLPVGLLIVRTYMDTVPEEVLEAARMDGAGFHRIFASVVLPLTTPALATAAIFLSISAWNELLFANLLSSGPASETLQVGVRNFLTSYAANYPEAFAGTVIAMAPTVIAYGLLSNRISTSMTAGALR
jgi:raffinose/stachyose/melibiose transport system permease protein